MPVIGIGGGGGSGPILSRRSTWSRKSRFSGGRKLMQSTESGMDWLRAHQRPGGFWDVQKPCVGHGSCEFAAGSAQQNLGVTSIALLVLLDEGYGMAGEPQGDSIRRAADWILSTQDPESGLLGDPNAEGFAMEHCLATWAVAKVVGMVGDEKKAAQCTKALAWLSAREGVDGLWRVNGDAEGDVDRTLSAFALHAFAIADYCSVPFDPATTVKGRAMLRKVLTSKVAEQERQSRLAEKARKKKAAKRQKELEKEKKRNKKNRRSKKSLKKTSEPEAEPAPPGLNFPAMDDEQAFWVLRWSEYLEAGKSPVNTLPAQARGAPQDRPASPFESLVRCNTRRTTQGQWQGLLEDHIGGWQRRDGAHKGSWDPHPSHKNLGNTWDPWGGRIFSTSMCLLNLQADWRFPSSKSSSESR